jgi:UDP-N-acetylglucosamine 2-epimerase (non-hydrolysing)
MKKILFVFGTRPEAIKLAPLILHFKTQQKFEVKICVTAQHREMLDQVLNFFSIVPDYDLNLMQPNQTLFTLTANALTAIEPVLEQSKPDIIFVQGDTTTVFAASLAAYYKKIKIAHIEAGLRSHNKFSPFPEEINRVLTGNLADFHFSPTENARQNLLRENITQNIYVVGNSVIDALFLGLDIIRQKGEEQYASKFNFLQKNKKIILITCHRRESFGEPFRNICEAFSIIARKYPDVELVYPVHLNPNIKNVAHELLSGIPNMHLIEPLDYPHLIWLMNKSHIVLTDSGGIQEEAPSLGKPVLVMREVTERTEGVDAGTAKLVGTDKSIIIENVSMLIESPEAYDSMSKAVNPYGDGTTARQIADIIYKIVF